MLSREGGRGRRRRERKKRKHSALCGELMGRRAASKRPYSIPAYGVTTTWSKVPVAVEAVVCDVTARPISAL